jgi:uncharacterized protein YydD (DUF2326 family)
MPNFKEVNFNLNGITIITGNSSVNNQKDKSYNGVGKSFIIELVHFCLGADPKGNWCEKIDNIDFYLDFIHDNKEYKIKRNTKEKDNICINDEEFKLKSSKNKESFKDKISSMLLKNKNIYVRELLNNYFLRRDKTKYTNPILKDKYNKSVLYEEIRNVFHLFNLDIELIDLKNRIKTSMDELKELINYNEKIYNEKEFNRIKHEKNRLEKILRDFTISEEYSSYESKSNDLNLVIKEKNNRKFLLIEKLDRIKNMLSENIDITANDIEDMYREAKFIFDDKIKRTLNEVREFYDKIKEFRKVELNEEAKEIAEEINDLKLELSKLEGEYNEIIKILDNSMSLNRYKEVNNSLNDYLNEERKLIAIKETLDKKKEEVLVKKNEMLSLIKKIVEYIKLNNNFIENINDVFKEKIEYIYEEKGYKNSYIGIEGNNGDNNKTAYNIEVHVDAQDSDGVTGISIFAFDLLLQQFKKNHSIDFIFHDSRLFESIDPRQIKKMFELLNRDVKNFNFQYICSFNEDKLNSVKDLFENTNEYQNLVENNIKLRLSDTNKLLGSTIDFKYV